MSKQIGVRLSDEDYETLTERVKDMVKEAPELQRGLSEGKIAAFAVREYCKKLREEKALSTNV